MMGESTKNLRETNVELREKNPKTSQENLINIFCGATLLALVAFSLSFSFSLFLFEFELSLSLRLVELIDALEVWRLPSSSFRLSMLLLPFPLSVSL